MIEYIMNINLTAGKFWPSQHLIQPQTYVTFNTNIEQKAISNHIF